MYREGYHFQEGANDGLCKKKSEIAYPFFYINVTDLKTTNLKGP